MITLTEAQRHLSKRKCSNCEKFPGPGKLCEIRGKIVFHGKKPGRHCYKPLSTHAISELVLTKPEYMAIWRSANQERIAEYNHEYRAEHKAKIAERAHEYNASHKPQKSEYNHAYHLAHREEILKRTHERYLKNQDKKIAYSRAYRAAHRKKEAPQLG